MEQEQPAPPFDDTDPPTAASSHLSRPTNCYHRRDHAAVRGRRPTGCGSVPSRRPRGSARSGGRSPARGRSSSTRARGTASSGGGSTARSRSPSPRARGAASNGGRPTAHGRGPSTRARGPASAGRSSPTRARSSSSRSGGATSRRPRLAIGNAPALGRDVDAAVVVLIASHVVHFTILVLIVVYPQPCRPLVSRAKDSGNAADGADDIHGGVGAARGSHAETDRIHLRRSRNLGRARSRTL